MVPAFAEPCQPSSDSPTMSRGGEPQFGPSELMHFVRTLFITSILAASSLFGPRAVGADLDFNRDVRPILSNACFRCHGPDPEHREAGLRLDTFEDATADRSGSPAIKPGEPDGSEMVRRVTSSDPDSVMPPTDSGLVLKPEQIALFREWIRQGARYQPHWAFSPIVRPAEPQVQHSEWVRNPLDRFVLAKLEAAALKPSPPADPPTLVRRVYLDLLGLPPTLDEADAFLNDPAADAYERLIDRVLASEHYGERWGRYWLDQARYADTNGYSIDSERSIWPYRDWVIQALNGDLPFDQFTIDQLAGDLLPNPTKEQRIATGFHRNTLVNQEGGTDARTVPQRGGRGPCQHNRGGVAWTNHRLRSVPPSQVRSDQPARLLPVVRVFQQRSRCEQRHTDIVPAQP